jgi:zinc/manganese transport system substrate-binding protein
VGPRLYSTCLAAATLSTSLALAGCAPTATAGHGLLVVGAESQYTSVLHSIGGPYVDAVSVLSSPNVDPHEFEAGTAVARDVASARVVVQNGMGYDGFMSGLESATSGRGRTVIIAQRAVGADPSGFNPHLWYEPATLDAVARHVARALTSIDPVHRASFVARLATFLASNSRWQKQIAGFRAAHVGYRATVTEPVADYLLSALGVTVATPTQFQADVMNGVDPAPQDVALVEDELDRHLVSVFCYNRQVSDPLTGELLARARADHVPVVAVYETMPRGYDVVGWMRAETSAIESAIVADRSTGSL